MATGTHSHRLHELTTLLVHMDDRRSWMKLSEEDKTMSKTIDAYFDIDSPASYLAWTHLPALLMTECSLVRIASTG